MVEPTLPNRRLLAILVADVAGYSRLMEADEEGTLRRLKAHQRELMEPLAGRHNGRVVKTTGDGALIAFDSVLDAVRCALAFQRAMAGRDAELPEERRIRFRIGINLGDVIVEDGDIFGDGVNVAARLEALAEPGGICISGGVRDQIRGKLALELSDLGKQTVKNIAQPVRVFRVALAGAAAPDSDPATLPLPDKPSVAVLPFANMSGDPEQEYFSDGITEDLITDLSKISALFVIARNSVFVYKGRNVDLRQVGRELGVRFVLEGSVRKAANRVRITAQLVDGKTGGHVWAERYDRELVDVFAVQDEVTREIVAALRLRLTSDEERRVAARGTENLEAYEHFLRGREQAWRHTREANELARRALERAVALDPRFAAAVAFLAVVNVLDYVNRWSAAPEDSLARGHDLARRAIALDDAEPLAHRALSIVHLWRREHDDALAEAERTVALDPNSAVGHALHGTILHYVDRSDEGLEALERAMRLDPHYPPIYLHFLAQCHFALGRYDEAIAALRKRIERSPETDISRVLLAACYGHLWRIEESRAVWAEVQRINPGYSLSHRRQILPYRNPASFEQVVEGLRKAGLPVD